MQHSVLEGLRLCELFIHFKQGDESSFACILKRFSGLIEKESFNSYLGITDEDLRAQIYLTLFMRLSRYEIPDIKSLEIDGGINRAGGIYEYQS